MFPSYQAAIRVAKAIVECHPTVFSKQELAGRMLELVVNSLESITKAYVAVEVEGRGAAKHEEADPEYDSEGEEMSLEALVRACLMFFFFCFKPFKP